MNNPVPVQVEGWTSTAYGVWALFIVQAFVLLGVAVKKGPEWLQAWANARKVEADSEREDRAARAAEMAAEETKKAAEKIAIAERLDQLEDRLTRMGQAVSFLMNAAITASNALEAAVPGSPAIKQSRDLIALAASSIGQDDPFSKALAQLANVRGIGE